MNCKVTYHCLVTDYNTRHVCIYQEHFFVPKKTWSNFQFCILHRKINHSSETFWIISWCYKIACNKHQIKQTNISLETFLNMIACKCFITFPSAPGPWRDLRSSLQLFVRKYATDMPRESLYKLSFNSNCLAWPLRLDDVINKLLKRLLVSFKPIVNSLEVMDHFNFDTWRKLEFCSRDSNT